MKCEYFVWTDRTRLPAVGDLTAKLSERGLTCQLRQLSGDSQANWTAIELRADTPDGEAICTITVTLPTPEEIDEMRQTYETLPFQVKKAARRFSITGECDPYGQASDFQLRITAVLAQLTNGVIDDPQENGLMLLDEFEQYIG